MDAVASNFTGADPVHPYFPLDVAIAGYAANSMGAAKLVGIFSLLCCGVFAVTHVLILQAGVNISGGAKLATMWFALCGCIHLFFEGYFAVNHLDMASQMDLFGQLWKEYSLSDSRYLTQDAFVVCMESITAFFWGPLSFFCAYAIVHNHPLRHPIQIIVSLGQIYGDILYYATCSFSKIVYQIGYCRPESFYFWMYYVLCNAFWIVIPGVLLVQSVTATSEAIAKVQATEAGKKKL
ncbi:Emopamil-binding protein [Dactylonectria estremocensis]|uniref:Emopamil-binding protein n=1 Tax=Dactylonectria estremocensis TaxID=1079267 RepID=A0A9P9JFN1_9HYPO|nr:Emopamil-binding protein [Dactylonectria estremocensis]